MNYFGNQMFNPMFVNQQNYLQAQQQFQIQNYQLEQDKKVIDAVNAMQDLMEAIRGMDEAHQREAFALCLIEIGKQNEWNK